MTARWLACTSVALYLLYALLLQPLIGPPVREITALLESAVK